MQGHSRPAHLVAQALRPALLQLAQRRLPPADQAALLGRRMPGVLPPGRRVARHGLLRTTRLGSHMAHGHWEPCWLEATSINLPVPYPITPLQGSTIT